LLYLLVTERPSDGGLKALGSNDGLMGYVKFEVWLMGYSLPL